MHVNVGEGVYAVGNTGNTGEPHLHIHAQRLGRPGTPMGGDPLPMRFDGRFLVRSEHIERP
jgi:murein DD-endopeptidase MepM/ murein hydrolase activator NlpD